MYTEAIVKSGSGCPYELYIDNLLGGNQQVQSQYFHPWWEGAHPFPYPPGRPYGHQAMLWTISHSLPEPDMGPGNDKCLATPLMISSSRLYTETNSNVWQAGTY